MNISIKTFFLLFFVTHYSSAINDTDKIKELKQRLSSHATEDSIKIDLLNEIGYQYWIVNPDQSIAYGIKGLELSKKLNYQKGIARANRVIGVAYWARGDQNKALRYLINSQKTYEEIKDVEGISNTMLNIGMVYADLEQYHLALDNYNNTINLFKKLNLDGRIATTYTKIATIFIAQGKMDMAKKHLISSLEIHTKNEFTYGIAEAHNRFAILYLNENKIELAYDHVKKSMELGAKILDVDGLTNNLILLGKIKRLKNEWGDAEIHLVRALQQSQENNLKKYELQAYEELIALKKLQKKFEQALYYTSKYIAIKDTLFNIKKSKQIAYLEFENQLYQKEKEVSLLKASEKTDSIIKIALTIGIFLISFIVFILYKAYNNNKQLLIAKNLVAQQELENSQLKEHELALELNFKNKELASYDLSFVQKNAIFKDIQKQLESLKEKSEHKNAPVFKELSKSIKQYLSADKDWENFKIIFEQMHQGFYSKLLNLHPNLKPNDLKICLLTRLNLNIKETANILGISPNSAKTARYRLRKKLRLEPSQEIISYLIEVENS
jgi:DNA-binding CsgD family transcriptional regulator